MNEVWNILEPYIMTVIGALTGGSIIAVIAKIICNRIIKKASMAYDINSLVSKIADKLAGKTINIDIASLVDDKLQKIAKTLAKEVDKVADNLNAYTPLLVAIGKSLARLKMLTDEEREALIKAVQAIDKSYIPPEENIVATVKLDPINIEPEETNNEIMVNLG